MLRYTLKRAVASVGVLLVVAALVFGFLHLIPGDPAVVLLSGSGTAPSPEAVDALRTQLGLDEPLLTQFGEFLGGLLTGDLGASLLDGAQVAEAVGENLPRSIELILAATLISLLVGVPAGTWAARRPGSTVDRVVSALSSIGISLPVYVVGVVAVYVFALKLGLIGAGGYVAPGDGLLLHLSLLLLPALTLSVRFGATIARMTRTAVLEVQSQDYVRTAQAKGITQRRLVVRHVVRNALGPVVTITGLEMGVLLGSTVLVERVFNWPGIGTLLVNSVTQRDYPMVQGIVLVAAALFVLINFLVDVVNGLIDPRVSYR